MKKNKKQNVIKTFFLIVSVSLVFNPLITNALSSTEEQLSDIRERIEQEKQRLNEAKKQSATLSSEINNLNTNISSTSKSISDLEKEISDLNANINQLANEIEQAKTNIINKKGDLKELVKLLYSRGQLTTFEVLASTQSITDFLDQEEYNRAIQEKINSTLADIKELKTQLESKKSILSENKKKTEQVKANLVAQKQQLQEQASNKNYLLQETKGDEAEYQKLIAKLQAQEKALQASIWSGVGSYVAIGHVNQGDIIGYIGNTGYSSGSHVHFEIRNTSQQHVNPANYIGNGYFIHPAPGTTISQGYGYADWGGWAPYTFHTGIDYSDGGRGLPVRATAEGDIVKRVTGQPNTYPYGSLSYGNYVMIKHANGMFSLYGHLR